LLHIQQQKGPRELLGPVSENAVIRQLTLRALRNHYTLRNFRLVSELALDDNRTVTKRGLQGTSALVGATYGVVFTLLGLLVSGGGHFNLVGMLFASPFGLGLLFWPLWAYLTASAMSRSMRVGFVASIGAHYFAVMYYVFVTDNSDVYWFGVGNQDSLFGWLVVCMVAAYLAGQIVLWHRFVNADDVPKK